MTWSLHENILYFGKLGADNLLLMLVGLLHLLIWVRKRKEGFRRLRAKLFEAIFFLGYGFTHDLYRYKPLRPLLLYDMNYTTYRIIILLVLLIPLYIQLLSDIKALYFKNSCSH